MKKIIVFALVFNFSVRAKSQQFIPAQKAISGQQVIRTSKVVERTFRVANKRGDGTMNIQTIDESGKPPDSIDVTRKEIVVVEKPAQKKVFGVFGAGNLNKEQLEKFNASGKFSCYVKPLIQERRELTFYLSFNKNATNNDSLLASTLIFPEVGNNSFLGTVEFAYRLRPKEKGDINLPVKEHYIVPFFEFSNKNIKASKDSGNSKQASYYFSTLNYTVGCKYLFHYGKAVENESHDIYFSMAGYLSYLNIPNQDTADYRILLKSKTINDNLWAIGLKVGVQYNNFSIFADFRHVLGSEARIPVRELRGFNSNIGVVFNADIFGL
jgi:hypothetical protein